MNINFKTMEEISMKIRCYEDNVIFDMPYKEIVSQLIGEGLSVDEAIEHIERTQNVKCIDNYSARKRKPMILKKIWIFISDVIAKLTWVAMKILANF